ncbi:DUF6082 family protein [Paractinoplanes toevensis]|uniref:Uncharacterized protein n=1 Tax=Paractinoplanes toevensis TaxID=571911 RepID=A0A919WDL8_9ACTN|nr:DUF6082 family protein [Actinoplanes toevensis]GIM98153.1 hypothetical protein Ato02nite_099460 [Actinoplanes toevensis]
MSKLNSARKYVLQAGGALIILVALLFSPFALLVVVGRFSGDSWARLSEAGQSYGFAAALFSAAALFAVSVSAVTQAKQRRLSEQQVFRAMQTELMRVAISEPDVYMPCYGAETSEEVTRTKQWMFCALRMRHWLAGFEMGEVVEAEIRSELAPEVYGNPVSRRWWQTNRRLWQQVHQGKGATMAQIIDEEMIKYMSNVGGTPIEVSAVGHLTNSFGPFSESAFLDETGTSSQAIKPPTQPLVADQDT